MSAFNSTTKRKFHSLSLIVFIFFLFFAFIEVNGKNLEKQTDSTLTISFIDIWQGDAIFIKTSDSKNILIDGGPASHKKKLIAFLEKQNVEVLHHVIATHLHPDHVGGLKYILDKFEVEKLYDPGISYDDPDVAAYEKVRDTLGAKYTLIDKRTIIEISPGVLLKVLNPDNNKDKDIHTNCIVIHLVYGGVSFLFTGDMNYAAEEKIIRDKVDFKSTVLKISHHGENDATSEEFLDAVKPKYAVISVGKDNIYKRPKVEVLKRLRKRNIKIFRTDLDGTITFNLNKDGGLVVITEK